MAQFSKGTYVFNYISRSKSKQDSKNNTYLLCEGVQSAGQYCSNIIKKSLPVQLLGLLALADCRRLRVCVTFWCRPTQRRAQHNINLSPTEFQIKLSSRRS